MRSLALHIFGEFKTAVTTEISDCLGGTAARRLLFLYRPTEINIYLYLTGLLFSKLHYSLWLSIELLRVMILVDLVIISSFSLSLPRSLPRLVMYLFSILIINGEYGFSGELSCTEDPHRALTAVLRCWFIDSKKYCFSANFWRLSSNAAIKNNAA